MVANAYDVVVLAGDRGPNDPLALHAGVPGKVLVPAAGQALISHVMQSLSQWPLHGSVRLVCRNSDHFLRAAQQGVTFERIEPAHGPAASLSKALQSLPDDRPVLVMTGDHPLVRAEWLQGLVEQAGDLEHADVIAGVVRYDDVMARFPGNRRTRYRFSDGSVCGTNLFLLNTHAGRAIAQIWQSFERHRKQPWKMIHRLGWINLVRYGLARLSLDQAFEALSARFELALKPTLLPWPEAAVDVDSVRDLQLVERILSERHGS
ncbi:MAG: nucleotidyltransferase family protein [Pseudomonadota bacterium]